MKRETGRSRADADLNKCRMLKKAILFAFQRSEVRVRYRSFLKMLILLFGEILLY